MGKQIATKVTTLLYNAMTKEELNTMDIQELQMFWGVLHHWRELTDLRIDQLKKEEAEKELHL